MSILGRLFQRDGMSDYRRGIVHFNNGEFDAAITAFERTLEIVQDASDPYYRLGRFYAAEAHGKLGLSLLHKGNLERAATEFRKAISCGYRYPDLHLHLAGILEKQGDLAGAEKECRAALLIHDGYLDARCLLVIAIAGQGRREEAALELAPLLASGFPIPGSLAQSDPFPEDPAFLAELRATLNHRQQGRWKLLRAVESYDRGDRDLAIAELRDAVLEQPRYADLRCRLGSLLLESGAPGEALKELEIAMEINPTYVEARLQAGLACLVLGDPASAVRHLRVAAEKQPAYPDTHLFLGLALLREGDLNEASRVLESVLAAVPGFHRARYTLGLVRLVGGRLDRALRDLRDASDGDPLLSRAKLDLGFLQVRHGEPEVAAALFRQVLDREPEDNEARLGLGLALEVLGQNDEAKAALTKALAVAPDSLPALKALARIGIEDESFAEAGEFCERALAHEGDDPDLHLLRARAWMGLRDFSAAKDACVEALRLRPGYSEARIALGLALFGLERRGDARQEMAAALRSDPTNPIARVFADERFIAEL